MADWLGIGLAILIVLSIIFAVIARVQGQKITELLADIRDLMKGDSA